MIAEGRTIAVAIEAGTLFALVAPQGQHPFVMNDESGRLWSLLEYSAPACETVEELVQCAYTAFPGCYKSGIVCKVQRVLGNHFVESMGEVTL